MMLRGIFFLLNFPFFFFALFSIPMRGTAIKWGVHKNTTTDSTLISPARLLNYFSIFFSMRNFFRKTMSRVIEKIWLYYLFLTVQRCNNWAKIASEWTWQRQALLIILYVSFSDDRLEVINFHWKIPPKSFCDCFFLASLIKEIVNWEWCVLQCHRHLLPDFWSCCWLRRNITFNLFVETICIMNEWRWAWNDFDSLLSLMTLLQLFFHLFSALLNSLCFSCLESCPLRWIGLIS